VRRRGPARSAQCLTARVLADIEPASLALGAGTRSAGHRRRSHTAVPGARVEAQPALMRFPSTRFRPYARRSTDSPHGPLGPDTNRHRAAQMPRETRAGAAAASRRLATLRIRCETSPLLNDAVRAGRLRCGGHDELREVPPSQPHGPVSHQKCPSFGRPCPVLSGLRPAGLRRALGPPATPPPGPAPDPIHATHSYAVLHRQQPREALLEATGEAPISVLVRTGRAPRTRG
jgi:hypothetical protein